MRRFLFFIMIVGISSKAFGQIEFKPKFKSIKPQTTTAKPKTENDIPPPTNLPKFDIPKIVAPNVFKETNIFGTKPKTNNSFEIGTAENHFTLTPTNKFVNPGNLVKDRLNKKQDNEGEIIFRRNQDLGKFKTKSLTARLSFRDYGQEDGDKIQILHNGKVAASSIYLVNQFKEFEITLSEGFNQIDFEALNQGALGPNTAEIRMYDDKGNLITASQWNLATGFKASILITKE